MSNLANYIASIGGTGHWRLGENGLLVAADEIGSNHLAWDVAPAPVPGLVNYDSDLAQDLGATTKSAVGTVYTYTNDFSMTVLVRNVETLHFGYIAGSGSGTDGWKLAISDVLGGAGAFITLIAGGVTNSVFTGRQLFHDTNYLLTVVRRAGTWELWINDLLFASSSLNAPIAPTTRFIIGDSTPNAGNDFLGIVDEVAVYNSPITAADILLLTKLVFVQPPSYPTVAIADSGDGFDEITIEAAVEATFPIAGYSLWESTTGGEDEDFDFTRAAIETIDDLETEFTARRAAAGKYYAIRAFDDRGEPNYSDPVIVASVAVPVADSVLIDQLTTLINSLAIEIAAIRKVAEGDQEIVAVSGGYELVVKEKGTETELISAKRVKQLSGENLTNFATQAVGGYVEEP